MRRAVWFFLLGVLAAALGAASAYAAGGTTTTAATTTTTTTSTTTTSSTTTTTATTTSATTTTARTTTTAKTTTTGTTTTAPAPPTYAGLALSSLPSGCVGAGAVAIAEPGRRVLTLGTPASSRGPSAYPTKAPIVRFLSSTASGSACTTARVALGSVSLFGGVVTASRVSATHGKGTVSGFEIYGSPVALRAGHPVQVGGWGEITLDKTVGRLTAPLVVQLLAAYRSLPAGTTIAFAFGASPQVARKARSTHKAGTTRSKQGGRKAEKHRQTKSAIPQPLTAVPGLGFKPSHYVYPVDSGASYVDTYGANRNDISDGWHHGDDLFAPLGTPIVAVARGTLSLVGWNELGGWRLWLTDKKGNSFYYAHLAGYARWILTHRHVRAGQVLGFLGRTGDAFTTTPHLHFEIHPHQPAFFSLGYDGAVDPTTYLHKWRIEKVPEDEIPQPATLKAPVGAPRQEAAVVWHELLVARHLLGTKGTGSTTSTAAAAALLRPFPHPPSFVASGAAPLPISAGVPTAERVSTGHNDTLLLVGGPLGAVAALSAAGAGAFFVRKRRRGDLPEAPLH